MVGEREYRVAPRGPDSRSGVGDFDNNGVSDIMWLNPITGQIENWLLAYS